MMDLGNFCCEVMQASFEIRRRMDSSFSKPHCKSDKNKLQTNFEAMVYETFRSIATHNPEIQIEVEGYDPVQGSGKPQWNIYVDPMDGTANICRHTDTSARLMGSDVTMVIAIAPHRSDLIFRDFFIGAGMDLRTGQIWLAETGKNAWTISPQGTKKQLMAVRNYHRHSPLIACEFYRRISWASRLLVNQTIEWSDMASSFMNILRVPLGETDLFLNNPLPGISNEGQRGHELGAIMPFIKEIQGEAVCTRKFTPLEDEPFTFDGMTPVMIGVDKATLDYYAEIIHENLTKELAENLKKKLLELLESGTIATHDIIDLLHEQVGQQWWSCRELS